MKARLLMATVWMVAGLPAAPAGLEQTVNGLIPKLAATKVEERYTPQMELQALVANASRPGAEAERAELSQLLTAKATDSEVPHPARVWIVRQLEYIGSAESVPALSALLNGKDAELKECARRALERNPAPAATETLRASLSQAGGTPWSIAVIHGLGERRDSGAVELIQPFLKVGEAQAVAVSALGQIATDKAVVALWEAYDQGVNGTADALIAAGNRLLESGKGAEAATLFRRLFVAGAAHPAGTAPGTGDPAAAIQTRCAALAGLAQADGEGAKKLIPEALLANDLRLQSAAVAAARQVYQTNISPVLLTLYPSLPPSAKVLVLGELDRAAEKQVLAAAADPDEGVRLAALETLGRIGGAASVPLLLKCATDSSGSIQKIAAAALARLTGPGADGALLKLAGQGEAKSRATAMEALAERNCKSAVPALMRYAADTDPPISAAACRALGKLATDAQIEELTKLALSGTAPEAAAALQSAASRASDKPAVARRLSELAQKTDPARVSVLFDALALLGGSEALKTVSTFAAGAPSEAKAAAIRALADWSDLAAVAPLLAIASDPKATPQENVLAVQGVVRLAKAADQEPAAARLDALSSALKAAQRPEDKKLALSAFAAVPDAKSAAALRPYLGEAEFKTEAGLAGVALAEALVRRDKPTAKDLARAVLETHPSEETARRAEAILRR